MKVAVIFGGRSTENYISRLSATSVINNLDREKYEVLLIGISKEGRWYRYTGEVQDIAADNWTDYTEKDEHSGKPVNGITILTEEDVDVIFPVLHGTNGEDGTVQGLFEIIGKPYVGCGVLASAVSMDKAYTKIICEKEGIPQAEYCVFSRNDIRDNIERCVSETEKKIGYPAFVKPSNAGSSFGVNKAKDSESLREALKTAAEYDIRVLAERFIDGREIECAVLGNDDIKVACPGEAISASEFYDYQAKYFNGQSRTEVPAKLTGEQRAEVSALAKRVFKCLDCRGLSRVDFFLERKTGKFIFNEINTLPGFTDISMYSKMWEASGIKYGELLDILIALALDNYKARERNYV